MLDAGKFREIVSGRRNGPAAMLARGALRLAEAPYTWAIDWRNARYDRDASKAIRVGVPVVSVGNLTLGGTGKTPMVEWLARWIAKRGVRAAIVSRGYGATAGAKNDEALELEQALPDVPHVQNPDRVAGATAAIREFAAQAIVLDDGFQHRRLARDLDIVLLDATEPFGFDHVFPRGTLREPVAGLRRAQVVCLSRADLLDAAGRGAIRRRAAQLAPEAAWCEAIHRPSELRNSGGNRQPLSAIAGRRVAAFCGIGNPAAFGQALERLAAEIVCWRAFPDHHPYSSGDLAVLKRLAEEHRAEVAITTQKDLVKLSQPQLGSVPLWALAIEMEFTQGEAELIPSLEKVVAG